MTNEELCLLAQDGNAKALSSLLECILPSIRLTAGKMQKHFPLLSVDTDDLVQEAMLGILKAIQAFQQEKDTLFLTFASSVANHTMLDYIRKCKTAVPESGPFLDIDAAPAGTDFDYMTYADIISNCILFFVTANEHAIIMAIHSPPHIVSNRYIDYLAGMKTYCCRTIPSLRSCQTRL